MALYNITLDTAKLHIAKGNSKIGKTIYSFSTLPGNKEHLIYAKGILLTDIPGTCTNLCEGCFNACYAVNAAQRHHNAVIKAWAENTLLLRNKPKELFEAIHNYISSLNSQYYESQGVKERKVTTWRWNVSGEIQNLQELKMMNDLARKHPEVQFGIYTKNFVVLGQLLDEVGETEPNFVVNISQWHHVADSFIEKYGSKCNVFEYDDSNLKDNELSEEDIIRLAHMQHCPAVTRNGKHTKLPNGETVTCDHCRRCYTKTGKHTAVYAH